jgi:hypothetical protein
MDTGFPLRKAARRPQSDYTLISVLSGVEEVFIATDYYDGPRRGIANYQGQLCDEKRRCPAPME